MGQGSHSNPHSYQGEVPLNVSFALPGESNYFVVLSEHYPTVLQLLENLQVMEFPLSVQAFLPLFGLSPYLMPGSSGGYVWKLHGFVEIM